MHDSLILTAGKVDSNFFLLGGILNRKAALLLRAWPGSTFNLFFTPEMYVLPHPHKEILSLKSVGITLWIMKCACSNLEDYNVVG